MERKSWIDVLRGMTMLMVIMGHCIGFTDNPINRMILCFHMALFYFISGMTFSPSKYVSLQDGLKRKFLGIGWQYICFSLMGIFIYYVFAYLGLHDKVTVHPLSAFIGVFYPDGQIGSLVTMGFWFVYDIIIIDLMCLIVYNSLKKKNYQLLALIGIYVVTMSFANIDVVLRQLIGLLFFIAGKLSINKLQNIDSFMKCHYTLGSKIIFCIFSIAALYILYYSSFCNIPVFMYKFEIGNVFIFIGNAVLGLFAFVTLALFISSNHILEWVGRNTLAILFSHFSLQRFFYLLANMVFPDMKKIYGEYVWSTTPYWIVTFLFLVLMSGFFAYVMNRYFPSLIGKGNVRNKIESLINKL